MREILFRGKRIDNGEWVEGSLLKVTMSGQTCYLIFGEDFSFDGTEVTALRHALVDPSTVGQYIGLTDKHGKKIFEGDILRFENDDGEFSLYLCEWNGESDGWTIRFLEHNTSCDVLDALFCEHAQVIWNIHAAEQALKERSENT